MSLKLFIISCQEQRSKAVAVVMVADPATCRSYTLFTTACVLRRRTIIIIIMIIIVRIIINK